MSKHVLICEDDEGIIDVATIVLEDKGYSVEALEDGNLIFKKIMEKRPDIILLDLWMPAISGEEIATLLKSNEHTKDIPVVFISASKELKKIAAQTKVDGFLPKPFDISELEETVEKYTLSN